MNRKQRGIMKTFVGCDVGELRVGILKQAERMIKDYYELVALGYLMQQDEKSRMWFGLTPRGKRFVKPQEN